METIEMRPPHGNNCHGHYTAIAAGGKGHWVGDGCGCFGGDDTPNATIDFIIVPLILTAVVICLYIFRKSQTKN